MDHLIELLGAPYYSTEDVVIYNVDCIDAMNSFRLPAIDLTITSPPYNIGKEYEKPLSTDEYISWCETWMNQIHDITNPTGAFWLNLGYTPLDGRGRAVPLPYLLWDKSPFYMIQEVVWHYGAGVSTKKQFSPRNEKFLWYAKDQNEYTFNLDEVRDPNVKYPNQKKNGKLKCNPLGKNPTDVWQFPKVTSGFQRSSRERTPHPAQFPLAVIDRIIKACSNKGDLMLDPFLGSGTTAIAALDNGRKFVGFEISQDYCDIAVDRIEKHLLNAKWESAQLSIPLGVKFE